MECFKQRNVLSEKDQDNFIVIKEIKKSLSNKKRGGELDQTETTMDVENIKPPRKLIGNTGAQQTSDTLPRRMQNLRRLGT